MRTTGTMLTVPGRDSEPPEQPEHPQDREDDADHADEDVDEVAVREPEDYQDERERGGDDEFDHLPEEVTAVAVPRGGVQDEEPVTGAFVRPLVEGRAGVVDGVLGRVGVECDEQPAVGCRRGSGVVVGRGESERASVVRERPFEQSLDLGGARGVERSNLVVEGRVRGARGAFGDEVLDADDAVRVQDRTDGLVLAYRPLVSQPGQQGPFRENVSVVLADVDRLDGSVARLARLSELFPDDLGLLDAFDVVERVGVGTRLTRRVDVWNPGQDQRREQHQREQRDPGTFRHKSDRFRESVS